VTNFNPEKDPEMAAAKRVVDLLGAAFSPEGPRE